MEIVELGVVESTEDGDVPQSPRSQWKSLQATSWRRKRVVPYEKRSQAQPHNFLRRRPPTPHPLCPQVLENLWLVFQHPNCTWHIKRKFKVRTSPYGSHFL